MSKNTRRSPTNNLQTLLDAGVAKAEIAHAIGSNPTSLDGWLQLGEMPVSHALACEALVRRRAPATLGKHRVLILQVPNARVEGLKIVLKSMGTTFSELTLSE